MAVKKLSGQVVTIHRPRWQMTNSPQWQLESDDVAIEEPLQISLQWFNEADQQWCEREWSLTMRTPGNDDALVKGLLLTQQVVDDLTVIAHIECGDSENRHSENSILVTLISGIEPDWGQIERSYVSQSSCGVCGMTSMRALCLHKSIDVDETPTWLEPMQITQLPNLLRAAQQLFSETGAVHGAGYYADGQLQTVAEDVGRHNAVDKVVGTIYQHQLWREQGVLVLSGRVSFELVQKALLAAIPVIVAVGAPSSLAVSMAKQFNITLIGFTKNKQFNVYNGHWRLKLDADG